MNAGLLKFGAITLSLSLAIFAAYRVAQAQSVDTPPIKMGLWQTEVSTTMSGMENMPMNHGGQHTTVSQGCLTPDTWKSSMQKMQTDAQRADCKVSNMHQDSSGLSFDESCSSARYNSDIHFQAQFDNSENMHGSAKMKMTAQGLPQPMTMDMTMTSHYLSSECGDVKPGEAKILK
jgi:Protein of unknown function (DUF3617)